MVGRRMTQVDFYVIEEQSAKSRETLACRIAEKAWTQGKRIFIHTQDQAQAEQMDTLLWTFRQGSFLPHELMGSQDYDAQTAIHIGYGQEPGGDTQVLINLNDQVPAFFSRFERVAEVINDDASIKQLARKRYQFYRDRGYPLDTHKLNP